ncbi:MAG: polyphosphate polymerase domain-containing protein [Planctomycetota bacterium]
MNLPPRYELKYWAREHEVAALLARLSGLLQRDSHASDARPSYTLSSLYLDTPSLDMFWEKVEGLDERRKLRLRRYDDSPRGFLELKGKRGRRVYKWREDLAGPELAAVARGDLAPLRRASTRAARVLLAEVELRGALIPAVITRYDREAYLLRDDPALRVTVDRRLCAHGEDLIESFLAPEVDQAPMLPMLGPEPSAATILEVKSSGPVPSVVAQALRAAGLERRAISKYCLSMLRARRLPTAAQERCELLFPEVTVAHA